MGKLQADHLFALPVAIPVAVGFHLAALLESAAFKPAVTGALLFALTRAPEQVRGQLIASIRKYISNDALNRGITTLKVLLGLGLAKQAHAYLNVLAQNNFRLRSAKSQYDWPLEIAVVTGAAGGIGSVMTFDLVKKGVKVIAIDIAPQMPDRLRNSSYSNRIFYYQCDLTDRAAVMDLADRIRSEHGHPSILINNAGIAYQHLTLQVTPQALQRIMDVNLMSYYWTIQAFLPSMIERRKGHVVTTASMASFFSAPSLGPYSETKVGLIALNESLRQELRRVHNAPEILLTMVHPTFVRTPMTSGSEGTIKAMTNLIGPEEVSSAVMKNIFSGRGGQVIVPGGLGLLPTMLRSFPHWLSYALIRTSEAAGDIAAPPAEKKMG